MPYPFDAQPDAPPPVVYEIRIKGLLDSQWTDWFEGLTVRPDAGDTLLTGPVIDQAALHGLLKKVRDLGLPLVSVNRVPIDQTPPHPSTKGEKMTLHETSLPASPIRLARVAGLLYLLLAIFAAFAFDGVYTRLYVGGDAAATAANVAANPGLVRMGLVADIAQATLWVFLALTLQRLLKHAGQAAASALVVLVAIGAGIVCLNTVFEFEGLRVAADSSYAAALGPAGANALALLMLDTQHYGLQIAEAFYGLWLLPLGYLAYKSAGLFPRWLGVLVIAGGAGWLADFLAGFLAPDLGAQLHSLVGVLLPVVAEVSLLGYLLIVGVRPAKH